MNDRRDGEMTEAELIRQLGELPRRVEPRNDPWPQIATRISAQPARTSRLTTPWFSLAAGIALAFAVGVFAGKNWQASPASSLLDAEQAGLVGTSSLGGALAGAEREYQAAFSEFATIGQSAPALQAATLQAIEHDWQEMLDAEEALSVALEQYPDNPWLNQRMLELRDRQLRMLKQLAGVDRISRRTEI
jgi:hypothetical protein